jgi:hypothetical protein
MDCSAKMSAAEKIATQIAIGMPIEWPVGIMTL